MKLFLTVAAILISASLSGVATAEAAPKADSKRQKVIDFEDEVVEGMNKRPWDSLNQISEADKKRRKPHLYRKRVGFRNETRDTMRGLKFTP